MSYTAIQVENLSKQYILRQQQARNYTALRDVMADKVKRIIGKGSAATERTTFLALDDVSFSIQAGDRVGIIGRNGAGKSTLLKVLSRIVTPTRGRITLEGRLASLLEVGTGFHPELTGRENIYLNGSILGMTKAEITAKFDEIVDFAEVEKFLDTPVKRYSSGMYVRLAFAVAAHLEPEILIVDEVLAVGDAAFQKKCIGRMREVAGEGRTVLFVSHNMEAVQKLCNTGILMHKGKLITDGPIDTVIRQYLDQQAADQADYLIDTPTEINAPGALTRVQIETPDHQPAAEIPVLGNWQVRLTVRIDKPLEHFVSGFGISTLMELPLRTVWSKPQALKPGVYEVLVHIDDIYLAPGMYKIVIGLSEQERTFHYVDNTVSFEISDAAQDRPDERIINYKSGLILNQCRMDVKSIS